MVTFDNPRLVGEKKEPLEVFDESRFAKRVLSGLLEGLLEVAILSTEATEGSIILLNQRMELLTMGLGGGRKKTIVRVARRHLGRSISAWVADHNEPLLLVGPAKDPRFSGVERDIKDAVCVPLTVEDRVIGILSVTDRRGSENFVQEDLEKLTALAEASAEVIVSILAYMDAEQRGFLWERKRLAQEIHDGLIQDLTAAILQSEVLEKVMATDPKKAKSLAGKLKEQARASLQELRRLVFDLRAGDLAEVSLEQMLERSVSQFERDTGIAATLKVTGQERELPPRTKGHLIAIAEESLANVKRHSEAEQVQVQLKYEPGGLELIVADDGRGFDWQEAIRRAWIEKKFGLMGMQERAHIVGGSLEIESTPGGGSTIKVRVPAKGGEVTDEG